MIYLIIFLQKPSGNGLVGDVGRAGGVLQGQGQAMVTDTDLVSAVSEGQPRGDRPEPESHCFHHL